MLRRLTATAAVFVAAVLLSLQCAAAPATCARAMILMDAMTGEVLAQKECDRQSLIASTTKIMTAYVVTQHCDLERIVTVAPEATGIEGSSMYLKPGERLTVRELLFGLMLHSGNDAAVALAIACAGNVERFVLWMNECAQQLSLANTHFANPNGLDDAQNYSTARDLAVLTAAALQNDCFLQIVSTRHICVGERTLTNHNKLLWMLAGAIGVKTGYTRAAGRILVSAAERDGRRLIAVTIDDGNDWKDHMALYEFGFSQYQTRLVFSAGEDVTTLELMDGTTACLRAANDFSFALAQGEKLHVTCNMIAFSRGSAGSLAGLGIVWLNDACVGTIPLIWGEEE